MSFENLFMVNGAVISDNIRSEPLRLYVEDALQEVTVATSGISAEYGRFTGGVVRVGIFVLRSNDPGGDLNGKRGNYRY